MTTIAEAPSARIAVPAAAFASFKGNRWPFTPANRIANSVRIALVGDSMVYGQGVPYTQTLGARLARHLNVARPGLWFDCQTFGLPGACAFHALARAEAHAAAIDPDVLVIALSQNDALMLRPQPPSEIATGQSWHDFSAHLSRAFTDFSTRWRAAGHTAHIAVVYFDSVASLGGIRPADVLRSVCADAGLLFLDGTEPMAGTPVRDLSVSPVDSHVNATAHDLVARHVARALLSHGWIAGGSDYSDAAWLDSIEAAADALTASDLPPAIAASEGLSTLRVKWLDRRNRSRQAHASRYQSIESRLQERVRREWREVILRSFQRELGQLPSIQIQICDIEDTLYRACTLNYALRHAAATDALDQPIDGLLSRWADEEPLAIDALSAAAQRARARAGRAAALIDAVRAFAPACADLRGLTQMAAHAQRINLAAEQGMQALNDLIVSGLPSAIDIARVVRDALSMWRVVDTALADADRRTSWPAVTPLLSDFAPASTHMTLTLNIAAAPGPELWSYRVGAFSPAQAVHEPYVACGWLMRDGQTHSYPIDLPLMVASTITVTIQGDGLGTTLQPDALKVLPARLDAPGVPIHDFRLSRATRPLDTECVIEFAPNLFTRSA